MANRNFFTREVKIALAFIAALAVLIYGINFLKGINIFTPTNHYIIKYENADGLVVSNGVYIKGYKVGQVRSINYDFTDPVPFTVDIAINKDIRLPRGTVAYMFDESIMGGKAVNLVFADGSDMHASGDTLPSAVQPGMLAALGGIIPQMQTMLGHIDSLVLSVQAIASAPQLSASLENIAGVTADLRASSARLNRMMNTSVPAMLDNIDTISGDIKDITYSISQMPLDRWTAELDTAINSLKGLSRSLESKDSSLGLLLNDKALYDNLNSTVTSATDLLIDLKENPKRYVHFSLWGAKEKKGDRK